MNLGEESVFGKDSYLIEKEECIGHVQKRMGAGLIELKRKMKEEKLDDGKGIGGKGRLTEKRIAEIQNNFGYAIREMRPCCYGGCYHGWFEAQR